MPAIDLTNEAKSFLDKRYYSSGYSSGYSTGNSKWYSYRWLLFLLILIPIACLICFWWGCKILRKRNRRRQEEGTAPTQQWDPYANQAAGANGQYYSANQQQQPPPQQDNGAYGTAGQYYNKEAASSNNSDPTYNADQNNYGGAQQTGIEGNQEADLEYPNQSYQRPSGPPPTSNY